MKSIVRGENKKIARYGQPGPCQSRLQKSDHVHEIPAPDHTRGFFSNVL
jgi:hypothetical protein